MIFILITLFLILPMVIGSASCTEDLEPITIGVVPAEGNAPIYVAQEKGFFSRNGLNVTVRDYASSLDGLDAVTKGEMNLAFSSEFAIVGRAFKKDNLSIIGSIVKSVAWHVIARKDHSIENITDLKGKKVALLRQTIGEFYLGRFLDLHGMNIADVTLVNTSISQFVDVISDGSVDAIVVWQAYAIPIKGRLGNNAVMWQAQENQPIFSVISGRTDWVTQHPETVKRFLKALNQAKNYITSHQTEAKAIVQKRLKTDDAILTDIWPNYNFSLSLELSLLVAMDDEARWMIDNNLTTEKEVPDFYDYIYLDGLKSVKPEAVNISR